MQRITDKLSNYGFGEVLTTLFERKLHIRLPISPEYRWKLNIKSEIRFWDKCIRTNGLLWPDEYRLRLDPNLPLQNHIISLLPQKDQIDILDVGAGPLTYIGKVYEKAKIAIIAVGPPADEYDRILKKYNVVPQVRTKKLDAEKLTTVFPPNSFDFVFARNCIDHSYSPEIALSEMLKVVKSGYYMLLMPRPDEAEKEQWQGLHQWNFSEKNWDFVISSKNSSINFSQK
jgi:SAM-dependent methyltransferase